MTSLPREALPPAGPPPDADRSQPILVASGLVRAFRRRRRLLGRDAGTPLRAVDNVSLAVHRGETLALVGESGAGKSTTGRLVLRLIEPDAGSVHFDGVDLLSLKKEELRRTRQRMQMIFQDPFSSLDPRYPVGESVAEPLIVHFGMRPAERRALSAELLARVGMGAHHLHRYPSELSGGQLQRVAIARALTLNPALIVCDEPVAALDVSSRAQVLNLLKELQEELGLAYLFISHDLALVEVIADRVAVMRAGTIVEEAPTAELFGDPKHEYTRQLLAAIPRPKPGRRRARRVTAPVDAELHPVAGDDRRT